MNLKRSVAVAAVWLGVSLSLPPNARGEIPAYVPGKQSAKVPRQPYERYSTTDAFGRTIQWYLSEEPVEVRPLPLVVFVQGSSWSSQFAETEGRIVGQNGHSTLADVVRGRARLLIVEKPGINYLDAPKDPPLEFRRQHTLDRWVEALHAATEAARALPCVNGEPTLIIGHSEGGLVAARLAAIDPKVTHVALLAGGGPSQLYDIIELARRGQFFQFVSDDPEARVDYVIRSWNQIQSRPNDPSDTWFGHGYPRWSSFLATSPMAELPRTNAHIFIAQGTADDAVTVESFDMLHAHLLSIGKAHTARRIEGADHNFALPAADGEHTNGWRDILEEVADWYLAPTAQAKSTADDD